MCVAQNNAESKVICAAGGLIWKKSDQGRALALIRRPQHADEWMLPKVELDIDGPSSYTALCTKMNAEIRLAKLFSVRSLAGRRTVQPGAQSWCFF